MTVITFGQIGESSGDTKEVKIAFLADVHLQDIHADFSDSGFKGIRNPGY